MLGIVLQWWFTLFIMGIVFIPLAGVIFKSFHDRGYIFAKTISIAISGYLLWLLSSIKLMKFTSLNAWIVILFCIALNIGILILEQKKYQDKMIFDQYKPFLKIWMKEEMVFLLILFFFMYIRGFKPEAYGTEKFMDYGFMASMMRSQYMPPEDLWFAGKTINYYYMGQYFSTYLTKISFSEVRYSYNLMLSTIVAFSCILPYSIVYNLVVQYAKGKEKIKKNIPTIAGVVAALAVSAAGNMHYTIFRWIVPIIKIARNQEVPSYNYWFPDATRYIGYFPETNDKTIHEFPAYSFVLGDLHAHVVNIIFVLTLIGILFAWLIGRQGIEDNNENHLKTIVNDVFKNPYILLIAFMIGIYQASNFWDFPIYYVVSGSIILFSNLIVYEKKSKAFLITAIQGIYIYIFSRIFVLPFTLSFDQISSEIKLAEAHTPLYQLAVLWGLPIYTVVSFIIFAIRDTYYSKDKTKIIKRKTLKANKNKGLGQLSFTDLFIILISLCAIGLVLVPEVVYIKDIYPGHKRANTMFKLTYQAFILFGISIGYIYVRILTFSKTIFRKRVLMLSIILFISTLFYSVNSVMRFHGNPLKYKGYKGIDSTEFLYDEMYDDAFAIQWLNDNIKGMPVVLEANGKGYTDYQRVSAMTGLPTIVGWHAHEWLWRSDLEMVEAREADVKTIYTSWDRDEVLKLIDMYNVEYIYVGKLEEELFPDMNHELIQSLGEMVYVSDEYNIKEYKTYIIKVDRNEKLNQ